MSDREPGRNDELIRRYFGDIDPTVIGFWSLLAQMQAGSTAGFQPTRWLEHGGEETSTQISIVERRMQIPLPPIAGQFDDLVDRLLSLETEIANLTEEIKILRAEIDQRPQVSSILLNELADEKIEVVRPISLIVEETDEEVLVRWPDTRIYAIGDTLSEALIDIKKRTAEEFLDLRARDPESLGEIAIYTLKIFASHLQINQ